MMKAYKDLSMFSIIVFMLVYFFLLTTCLPIETLDDLQDLLFLSRIFVGCILFLIAAYLFFSGFGFEYTETAIQMYWWRWNYKNKDYANVKCITIVGAVFGKHSIPICDKFKRQKAVVSLYATSTYGRNLHPRAWRDIYDYQEKKLCHDYLDLEKLRLILKKTVAEVYITELMFWLYKESLWDIFMEYADRVTVSCTYDNYDGFKRIPFRELPNYFQADVLYENVDAIISCNKR